MKNSSKLLKKTTVVTHKLMKSWERAFTSSIKIFQLLRVVSFKQVRGSSWASLQVYLSEKEKQARTSAISVHSLSTMF